MASRLALRPAPLSRRSSLRLVAVVVTTVGVLAWMASAFVAVADVVGAEPATAAPQLVVRPGVVAEGLYPGSHADLQLSVTNLGERDVTPTTVVATDTVVSGGGACGARDFSVRVTVPSGTVIPAGGSRELVLPDAITMRRSAGDGCQGVTISVRVSVTVASVAAA